MSMIAAVQHGLAEINPDVRIYYVLAGQGPRTVVLLHGYPQTWWEFRHVIPMLVDAGYRVIAPDYRGAGDSNKPPSGYDKRTMAQDIYALLYEHLKLNEPVLLLGHDIGCMVAYAFAVQFPKAVRRLVLMEAPIPGTASYAEMVAVTHLRNVMHWHFFFHNATNDLAETLTAGRERVYLQNFYQRIAFNHGAFTPSDIDAYASWFSAAGAMRAGFELYRAFDRDADDNRAALKKHGRLGMPVLGMGGAESFFVPIAPVMLREVAKDVRVVSLSKCGHWCAEEQPEAFVAELLKFDLGKR